MPATVRGICAILLGDDPAALARELEDLSPRAAMVAGERDFESLVARVVGIVEFLALGLDLTLDIRGTTFQRRIWQALQDILAGTIASDRSIADRGGSPKAARAVARACASNPLAVAIPCECHFMPVKQSFFCVVILKSFRRCRISSYTVVGG